VDRTEHACVAEMEERCKLSANITLSLSAHAYDFVLIVHHEFGVSRHVQLCDEE